jgi:hypothetical protein
MPRPQSRQKSHPTPTNKQPHTKRLHISTSPMEERATWGASLMNKILHGGFPTLVDIPDIWTKGFPEPATSRMGVAAASPRAEVWSGRHLPSPPIHPVHAVNLTWHTHTYTHLTTRPRPRNPAPLTAGWAIECEAWDSRAFPHECMPTPSSPAFAFTSAPRTISSPPHQQQQQQRD